MGVLTHVEGYVSRVCCRFMLVTFLGVDLKKARRKATLLEVPLFARLQSGFPPQNAKTLVFDMNI